MIHLHEKSFTCPVDVSLSFINGKWKILILFQLHYFKQRRFSEIRNNLPGVTEKVLSQQLKELEKDKLITRTVITEKPLRVAYALTQKGNSLSPLLEFLSQWGIDYLRENGIDYVQDQHLYK